MKLSLDQMGELVLLLFVAVSLVTAGAAAADSAFLPLPPGLVLRMPPSYNVTTGQAISLDLMFTLAMPTLDAGGLFFPILSSPSFNTTASNSSSFGFSLGFYFLPLISASDGPNICYAGCNIYMALCAGSIGHKDRDVAPMGLDLSGAISKNGPSLSPHKTADGFAAPVWIANLDSPIRYADKASLLVELVADSNGSTTLELQLRDGENAVWRVRNVSVLEIQDTGHLLIYDSPNRSHQVWESSGTDSLLQGQSLTPGRELVSNDSSYVARMERGGLVFYMNKTHFNRELQPPAYWLFPVLSDNPTSLHFNINGLISSAPCSSSPAHADAMIGPHAICLYPGLCSSWRSYIQVESGLLGSYYWNFWRLENDGMLYNYVVYSPGGYSASFTRIALGMFAIANSRVLGGYPRISFTPPFLEWQECNVPMACGPLGVCTPGGKTMCSCSDPDFVPINVTDFSQGCKRRIDLPNCTLGKGHTGSTDYVQLDSTTSILLFSGWTFNPTHAHTNDCKQQCSSDCSCNGFFYQNSTSSCFFMIDAIGLMTVVDKNLTFADYTGKQDPRSTYEVLARDYVTFLKVTVEKTSNIGFRSALGVIVSAAVVCLVLGILAGYRLKAMGKEYVHNNILANEEKEHRDIQLATEEKEHQDEKELQDILPLLPSRFSYKDLFEATKGFNTLLGAGGYGSVYAGVLPDGRKVAIKVLRVVLQGPGHSKQFLAEIATIGRTCHHNIVRLIGFCWEVSQRLLVYEYLERGSLDHWIFPAVDDTSAVVADPLLDWKTRYNIAVGIARGLNYLHEECEQPILHFDIKPENILLDNDFVAKLADFGMSKLVERNMSAVVTGIRGTPGYIAPEWCFQGTVSKKSDVYSMGMVLLEMIGGRRNLDASLLHSSCDVLEQDAAWHFPSWGARKCEQGMMMELVDVRLHVCGFDAAQALRLIHIAFWCIQEDPAKRPNAPTVVLWLEGSAPVEQPPFSETLKAGRHANTKVPASSSQEGLDMRENGPLPRLEYSTA